MGKRVEHPDVVDGYDRWATTYDATPNPLVAIDRRHTFRTLDPRAGELVLDAGCGTGVYLRMLLAAQSLPVGLDLSPGMLRIAKQTTPGISVVRADLNRAFPVRPGIFDAVISTLVSEHLTNLQSFFLEVHAALRSGGRFVFSAFHPELARSGIEANFERDGIEYRLGAELHTMDDYLTHISNAGFNILEQREYAADSKLISELPWASKYSDRPLLAVVRAERTAQSPHPA
jgi:SAM-dependent methyltransferase